MWALTLSCKPVKGLGIGMMVLESIDCKEHSEKNVCHYHIPLYCEYATEEDVTFSFTDEKQERILRLERYGQVYYRKLEAQSETVLASSKKKCTYLLPKEHKEIETVISFRVLPQCPLVQQGPSREAEHAHTFTIHVKT